MTSVALRGFAQRAGSRALGISPFKMVGLAFAWCAALLVGALGAAPERAWAQDQVITPQITSLTPSRGPRAGGTPIVITGSGFLPTSVVTYDGQPVTAEYISGQELRIVSLPWSSSTGRDYGMILVTNAGASQEGYDSFQYEPFARIQSLSVALGSATVSQPLTIQGYGFTGTTSVTIAGQPVPFTLVSDTEITTTAPAISTPGLKAVVINGTNGSSSQNLNYPAPPVITQAGIGVSEPGREIAVRGTGFTGATAVTVGGVPATFRVAYDDLILLTLPAGSGAVDISVTTPGGVTVASNLLRYVGVPVVMELRPAVGSSEGGNRVHINGQDLGGTTSVMFGNQPGRILSNGDSFVSVYAPSGTGVQQIRVTTSYGTSAVTPAADYTYFSTPVVQYIEEDNGPEFGGTEVSIEGLNFENVTAVKFGSVNALSFTVQHSGLITAVSPPGVGSVDVSVITSAGTSTPYPNYPAAARFTYVDRPVVLAVTPASGPIAGGNEVEIIGGGFTGATAVYFHANTVGRFTVHGPNRITATVPAGVPGEAYITVVKGGQESQESVRYNYIAAPVVTAITPGSGPSAGGTSVTITGDGFAAATAVRFGDVAATSFVINNSTRITAIAPAGTGEVQITVVAGALESASTPVARFVYGDLPIVGSVAPNAGPEAGGTAVTLSGIRFTGATQVLFGDVPAASFTVNTDGSISATTPAHAGGRVNVVVVGPAGASIPILGSRFLYGSKPVIEEVTSPIGTYLTLRGGNFTGATAVTIGGVPAAGFGVNSGSVITATPAVGVTGPVDIVVEGPGGASAPYRYTVAPLIDLNPEGDLQAAKLGRTYQSILYVSGPNIAASAPFMFEVVGGELPPGLTLSTSTANYTWGLIAGTPTDAGTYDFSVRVTDNINRTVTKNYRIVVAAPVVTIAPANLGALTYGQAVSVTLSASGTVAPYTFAVTGGELPAGLDLNGATGVISGTPAVAGAYSFTVTATDSSTPNAFTGQATFTGTVEAQPPVLAPPTVDVDYNALTPIDLAPTITGVATAVAITTQPTHGSVTIDGLIVTYTPTAGYVGADGFAYTVTGPGGTSEPATATINVKPPVFVFQPQTLADATREVAYSATIGATGGTAPYSYSIVSGALPAGLEMSAGGIIQGLPTVSGVFNFTVKVVDASTGVGASATQAFTLTVGAPPLPVAGPKSVTVAYPSTSNGGAVEIDLSDAVQHASGIQVTTQPTHGSVTIDGLIVTYTPTAGYVGPDSFAYTAAGPGGTSAPATVSITVQAPVFVFQPQTLADATQAVAYSATVGATGGTAPYSYSIVSGALPAGLEMSAGGIIQGMPTVSGVFNFTVKVTDASTGLGASATHAFTLTVGAPPAPVAEPKEVTVAITPNPNGGGSAEIDLSDAVQYASGIQIVRQPTYGTLTVDGFVVTYTPNPGYYGEDSFDYVAVPIANNPSVSRMARAAPVGATVTITIAPPTLVFGQTTLPNGEEDVAYSQTLTASGGTAPYSFAVTTGALPDGLTLSSAGVLSGTPTVGGVFNFTVTATDSSTGSGPFTVAQAFTLTLRAAVPEVAAPIEVATIQGKEVVVDLTAGATGGPFTGAAVVTLTPADAGEAKIVETGSGATRGYSLSFKSTGAFSGVATVTYTLSNASGPSAPGTVSITVEARPDPSQDPDVRGIVTAQTDAAVRMAEAQIGNFGRRMESLHSGGSRRFQQGVTLGFGFADGGLVDPWTQREIDMDRSFDFRPETMASAVAQNPTTGLVHPRGLMAGAASGGGGGSGVATEGQVSIWTGGSIQFGRRDPKNGDAKFDFTTAGLSMGADIRVNERLAVGVGGGFGQSDADVGSKGSRVEASNRFGVLYGSFQPVDGAFIDGMVGYGQLDFDTRRKVSVGVLTPTDVYATGSRSGDQLILSVSAGWDFRRGDLFLSPYARVSSITGTLDAYAETGAGLGNLRYDDQDLSSLKIALGARGERTFKSSYGLLTPRFRLEYQRELKDSELATVSYDDWVGGPLFSVIADPFERDQWVIGIGGELRRKRSKFSLDYQGNLSSGRDFVSELTGQISIEF